MSPYRPPHHGSLPPPPPVGPILREYRLASGLSQEELARRASLSMRYVSLVETGKTNPTMAAVGRILLVLGLTWTELAQRLDAG
jgi:transcriptional regulator with XRE-family HTH domain